ncbi:DNA mismatch repair protein isoform X2 [Wolffia australiana]
MAQVADGFPKIKAISKEDIHRICSGQVILDLSAAVKELVENSLDAGATSVEINLKEFGEEYIKVTDNGSGISPADYQTLALKHHTSKISKFPDLQSLTTFGFRGEALSSLCALGSLSVETRTINEAVGTRLKFDKYGLLMSETKVARQVGTTVTIEKLFSSLPVRFKEFIRNIRREYGKLVSLVNAYALIAKGVRFVCTNITGKNVKTVVLKTQASSSLKENIINTFGLNFFSCLEALHLTVSEGITVEGFLSKPLQGTGRNLGDRQFYYVNGRPVDMPKVGKLVNELYRCSNSKQYPIVILNMIMPTQSYDVNITPDKRKIFLSDECHVMSSLREALEKIYAPGHCSYKVNKIESTQEASHEEMDTENASCDIVIHSGSLNTFKGDEVVEAGKEFGGVGEGILVSGEVLISEEKENPEDYQQEILTADQFFISRSSPSLLSKSSGPPNSGKSVECDRTQYAKPGTAVNFIQSSLSKFLDVKKRKHESSLCSEMPLLRNNMDPVQAEELSTYLAPPLCGTLEDETSSEGNQNKASKRITVAETATKMRSQSPVTCPMGKNEDLSLCLDDAETRNANTENDESFDGSPSRLASDYKDVSLPKTHSAEGSSFLHFNIDEVCARRSQSLSYNSVASKNRSDNERCYSAATLMAVQLENQREKAELLNAATFELEKYFKKEDFGRMKHAADEKYNFERLAASTVLNQQPLLKPLRLELSPEEEVIAVMHSETIRKNGFSLVEDANGPPGQHFLLTAVPFSKNITFGVEDVKELLSILADVEGECSMICSYKMDTQDSLCPSRVRAMLASRACRSSVRIGDPLAKIEMQKIVQNLSGLKSPWNCPHGRPTMRHLVDLATLSSP